MIFTTSWDDGYEEDMRVAQLLERHGAKGTFYVCPQVQHGRAMLTKEHARELGMQQHEIGAHTMTHPRLSRIALSEAEREIRTSKEWVEDFMGRECTMFCYPYGDRNDDVRDAVMRAGFRGGRTVQQLSFTAQDRFVQPTSFHLYPFPWRPKRTAWWHWLDPLGPLRVKWQQLNALEIPFSARTDWQRCARALFLHALETRQPFFHLWGHAFELKRYDLWDELDRFLAFVARHPVTYATNGELTTSLFPPV